MSAFRTCRALWLAPAFLCLLFVLVLSPSRFLAPLPARAAPYRADLEQGLLLVRCGLAAAAILTVLSALCWPRTEEETEKPAAVPPGSLDLVISAALLALSALLLLPSLRGAFWWDELTSL